MEKLLILLSILIINETTVPSVIAASFYEKKDIKDVNFHLKTNDNTENLDRNKRSSEDYDLPDVSNMIKEMLTKHWISNNKWNGKDLTSNDFTLAMDIKIKSSVHQILPNGTIERNRRIVASDSTMIFNADDFEQKIRPTQIILNTTTTESWTISNTFDISGDVEIPSIPLIDSKKKIVFKLSKSSSATDTKNEEISHELPSQKIMIKSHSSKTIKSDLYASDAIYKYFLTFELDESSTFTVKYKEFPVDPDSSLGEKILQSLKDAVDPMAPGNFIDRREKKLQMMTVNGNIKESLEFYVISKYKEYPKTVYNGSIPCIEFKDNKIYISYFPLEIQIVKTYLDSHIEDD